MKRDLKQNEMTFGKYKFRIPTGDEAKAALGLAGESTLFKKILTKDIDTMYSRIPVPKDGDWLMTHKEYGQTFDEFIRTNPKYLTTERNVVYLVSLSYSQNATMTMNPDFVMGLRIMAEAYFYGLKIKLVHKSYDLDTCKISMKLNLEKKKFQMSANQILSSLYCELPKDTYALIAFTDQDLYIDTNSNEKEEMQESIVNYKYGEEDVINENEDENNEELELNDDAKDQDNPDPSEKKETLKPDQSQTMQELNISASNISTNFTFGLSFPKLRISLFSFARYDPLFYYQNFDKEKSKNNEMIQKFINILLRRSCKVLIKEICLMMGLKNCVFYRCIMNGFYSMEEFDNLPLEACPVCLRKIYAVITSRKGEKQRMLNPSILYDRWIKMKDALEDYFSGIFDEDINWYSERIDSIKEDI